MCLRNIAYFISSPVAEGKLLVTENLGVALLPEKNATDVFRVKKMTVREEGRGKVAVRKTFFRHSGVSYRAMTKFSALLFFEF